jgi:hypothetical protein
MRALHIVPAQLQKAFPHLIGVRYSEKKDCHHKTLCTDCCGDRMNRMVQSMHPEVVINNLVHPGNIIYHDIQSVKPVIHSQEIVRFIRRYRSRTGRKFSGRG